MASFRNLDMRAIFTFSDMYLLIIIILAIKKHRIIYRRYTQH